MRSYRTLITWALLAMIAVPPQAGANFYYNLQAFIRAPQIPTPWGFDGVVNTVIVTGTTAYIGGEFGYTAPLASRGAALNLVNGQGKTGTGNPDQRINGASVNAVISDGAGGWYVGGNFISVGGVSRKGVARVDANGKLDPTFDIGNLAGGTTMVNALALSGGRLYIGGDFTTIGGQSRTNIAAVDSTTGAIDVGWNPGTGTTSPVLCLLVAGSNVYAGGTFTFADGLARSYGAAFNLSTGVVQSWNPNGSGVGGSGIRAMAFDGSNIFVGGKFNTIGGQSRANIAALNPSTATATTWNPGISGGNNTVYSMLLNGTTLFVGGDFDTAAGNAVYNLAAINNTTAAYVGSFTSPEPAGIVRALAMSGSRLYIGGTFPGFMSVTPARRYLCAVNVSTGALDTGFDAGPFDQVSAVAADGAGLYAGGAFLGIGGVARNGAAAIDLMTGRPNTWNPNVTFSSGSPGRVKAMIFAGSNIALGGYFQNAGGGSHNNIALVNMSSGGEVAAFAPNVNQEVAALATDGTYIYLGGQFTQVNATGRTYIAKVAMSNGALDSFNPTLNGFVYGMVHNGSNLYFVGAFTGFGTSNYVGAVTSTGTALGGFSVSLNGRALTIGLNATYLYVGGEFTQVTAGPVARNHLAAFHTTTGSTQNWNPNADQDVYKLTVDAASSVVYVSGAFANINGGTARAGIAAVDSTPTGSGAANAFNVQNGVANVLVGAMAPFTAGGVKHLIVGGDFYSFGNGAIPRSRFTLLNAATGAVY